MNGGVVPSNILWNFPGTGSDINIFKSVTVAYGIFLAPQRNIIVDGSTITGAVIGGAGGQKIDIHSAAKVVCK